MAAGLWFFTSRTSEVSTNPQAFSAAISSTTSVAAPVAPPEGFLAFKSQQYGFTLYYPPTLQVKEYAEAGGAHTASFEEPGGAKGFQIFVTPYSGDQITQERFHGDVPSGVMKEPTDIYIDGARATMFFSTNALMGDTREVWFIRNGYLYEVTTYKELDSWLAEILKTWKW
jgi:hypothetical protein